MITSKSNELIKKCLQIKQKKYSKQLGLCLVESLKLVKELDEKGLTQTILVVESKYNLFSNSKTRVEIVSDTVASLLSDAVTTDGVFAICKILNSSNIDYSKCIILDRIQDPTNIGAILRSACAFGYNTIFAIDSVYPYSFKSIRSSMGNIFNVNYIDIKLDDLIKLKSLHNIDFVVADMNGEDLSSFQKDSNKNIAIVIGNEGQGVSDEILKVSDKIVSIPMQNDVESLNASVSAGIIMYVLK